MILFERRRGRNPKERARKRLVEKKSGGGFLCRFCNRIGGWRPAIVARKHFLISERHWKLINILFIEVNWQTYMFRTQKLCPGHKNVFDENIFCFRAAKFVSARCFFQNNVSATIFPKLARPSYSCEVFPISVGAYISAWGSLFKARLT